MRRKDWGGGRHSKDGPDGAHGKSGRSYSRFYGENEGTKKNESADPATTVPVPENPLLRGGFFRRNIGGEIVETGGKTNRPVGAVLVPK